MKALFFMVVTLFALSVLADIPPSPIPLHRIGYEILAGIAGTAIAGGAVLQAVIKRCRDSRRDDWVRAHHVCGRGYVVRTDRSLADNLRVPLNDASTLRFLTKEEVVDMKRRLKRVMAASRGKLAKEYAVKSAEWLKDPSCPCAEKREIWWQGKCEEWVLTVILQDEPLRRQLKGVPIEWVVRTFAAHPRLTCAERFRLSAAIVMRSPKHLLELVLGVVWCFLRICRLAIVFPFDLLGCLIDACDRRRRGK